MEYGFIGVSPSGERVEGFSAPLQFWVASLVYRLHPFDYAVFLRVQTVVGTLVLGALIAWLFLLRSGSRPSGWRLLFVACALVGSAYLLAGSRAFLLWHASGMENVFESVTLVALMCALDLALRRRRHVTLVITLAFLAATSRVDAIVPTSALLAAFAVLWWIEYRTPHGIAVSIASLGPWALYMAWRWWYFGQWEPNTAVAQGIVVGDRLAALGRSPRVALADWGEWLSRVGPSLNWDLFAWAPVVLVFAWRSRWSWYRCALVLVGGLGVVSQFVLFGSARMDEARTVTALAVYAVVLVPFVLLGRETFRLREFAAGVLMFVPSAAIALTHPPDRNEVGWGTVWFEQNADEAHAIAERFDIPRPTLANVDLGAVSWRKSFNVIDLGKLGSAIVSRTRNQTRLLMELLEPDIIELHDSWSCLNSDLFDNETFRSGYVPVRSERNSWLVENCGGSPQVASGVWVRRAVTKDNASQERRFLDRFRSAMTVDTVTDELSRCLVTPTSRPCAYVGRTLYRFVPELKAAGAYDAIGTVLTKDSRLAIEHAFFTSSTDPLWWRRVLMSFDPVPPH